MSPCWGGGVHRRMASPMIIAASSMCAGCEPPFAFPLCLTSGSPSLCPRTPVASGHPPCALWCRFSTPVPDCLLWLLTVSVGLADLHCLPPAPALPPEYHGWPGERCDVMLSWHPDISSDPVNRRKRQTGRGVGCCMSPSVETVELPFASPVVSPACWCLGAVESPASLSSSLSSIGYQVGPEGPPSPPCSASPFYSS